MLKDKLLSKISNTSHDNSPLPPYREKGLYFFFFDTNEIISFVDNPSDDKNTYTDERIEYEFVLSYSWSSDIDTPENSGCTTNSIGTPINKTNHNNMNQWS